MRSAWNVRFAGLPPVRRAGAGMVSADELDEAGAGRERLALAFADDRPGQRSGELLLPIGAQDPGQLPHGVGVEHLGRGDPAGLVHAHVQDRVLGVGEPAVGHIELHGGHPEVEQDRVDPSVSQAVRSPPGAGRRRSAHPGIARRTGPDGRWPAPAPRCRGPGPRRPAPGGPPASPRCGRRGRGWHRPPPHRAGSVRARAAPGSARGGRAHAPVPGSPGNHELVEHEQRDGRAQDGRREGEVPPDRVHAGTSWGERAVPPGPPPRLRHRGSGVGVVSAPGKWRRDRGGESHGADRGRRGQGRTTPPSWSSSANSASCSDR